MVELVSGSKPAKPQPNAFYEATVAKISLQSKGSVVNIQAPKGSSEERINESPSQHLLKRECLSAPATVIIAFFPT